MKRVVEYVQSFVVVVLVLAAISGMSYHAFRDDGWVEKVTGQIWSLEWQYPLIAIPVTIGAIVLFRLWRQHRLMHGRHYRLPDFVIYVLMALGAYFISQFILHGAL